MAKAKISSKKKNSPATVTPPAPSSYTSIDEQCAANPIVKKIYEALNEIIDPEIGIGIADLGLIYDVELRDDNSVQIKMTLTSQGCPAAGSIPEQVKLEVGAIAEVRDVNVEVIWDPPWDPSRITPEGRQKLGIDV